MTTPGKCSLFESRCILKLRFTVPDAMSGDDVHEMGERLVGDLMTGEPVIFDSTAVVDES